MTQLENPAAITGAAKPREAAETSVELDV